MVNLIINIDGKIINTCLSQATQYDTQVTNFEFVNKSESLFNFVTFNAQIPLTNDISIWGELIDVNFSIKRRLKYKSRIEKGQFSFLGYITFDNVVYNKGKGYANITFVGGIKNFTELLPENCWALNMGTHLYNATSIKTLMSDEQPYNGSNPIWYSLKNYGGDILDSVNHPNYKNILPNYMKPDIMLGSFIDAIQRHTKVKIKSEYFNSEYFNREYMPYTSDKIFVEYLDIRIDQNIVNNQGLINLFASKWISDRDIYGLNASNVNPLNQLRVNDNIFGFDAIIDIQLNILSTEDIPLFLVVSPNDLSKVKSLKQFTVKNGINNITWEGKINNDDGTAIQLFSNEGSAPFMVLSENSNIKMRGEVKGLTLNGIVYNSSLLPKKTKPIELLNSICDLDNLIYLFDENTNTLIIDPPFNIVLPTDEVINGIFSKKSNILEKDCNNIDNVNYRPFQNLTSRLNLKLKEDENDFLVNDDTGIYTHHILGQVEDGDTDIQNTVFSPCINKDFNISLNENEKINVPTIINYNPNDPPSPLPDINFNFSHKILYKFGLINASWVFNDEIMDSYPFGSMEHGLINLFYSDNNTARGKASIFWKVYFMMYESSHTLETISIIPNNISDFKPVITQSKYLYHGLGQGNYIPLSVNLLLDPILKGVMAKVKFIKI